MKKFILIGLSIMTFMLMTLTSFAATGDFPKFEPQSGYNYVEWWTGSDFRVFTWDSSSDLTTYYKSSNNNLYWEGNGSVHQYTYNSTRESWSYTNEIPINGLGGTTASNFVKSTVNIYTPDGSEVVFPLPPSLAEVTEMELSEMGGNLGQTMSTLALCGVGCLALLIGLNLLRRKSVLFLNR